MLDVAAGAPDRGLVERYGDEPAVLILVPVVAARHQRLSLMATERACARKPLRRSERDGGVGKRAQLLRAAFEDRGAFHEVEHAEAGGEARRARGRQHVVRAGHIVADRLRRMRADENRAGIADAPGEAVGVRRCDFQMLRRDRVDQRHRFVEIAHHDHGAEIAP